MLRDATSIPPWAAAARIFVSLLFLLVTEPGRCGETLCFRPLGRPTAEKAEAARGIHELMLHDRRLYLGHGIFAEVTLHCHRGQRWTPRDWTYPDYRNPTYHEYLTRCRSYLRGASGKSEKK